jgi:hypothetical protein
MEASKRTPLGTRPKASRPKASRRKVKASEVNANEIKPDENIRKEVAEVLDGLVYLTESVAKLEGISRTKGTRPKAARPKVSRRKVKASDVKSNEVKSNVMNADKKIRNEVASVRDGLVYLTESVAKLERGSRVKSANNVSRTKSNDSKNLTSKIINRRPVSSRSRSRKSESDVIKGIKI